MRLFLLTFFLLYGALHFYVFARARAAFAFGTMTGFFIVGFMLAMIVSPVVIRFSEKAGYDRFAQMVSWAGYTWMGVIFLFFSFSLLLDVYRLTVSGGGFILRKDVSNLLLTGRHAFVIPLLISVGIACYGYVEAANIRTERIVVRSQKIPAAVGRVRIAQISDVHLGLIVRDRRLKSILEEVRKAEPDILVSTGDLVDGQIDNLTSLAEMLREVNPRYGKFAVTGNHEFYAGIEQSLAFIEQAGFRMLRGEWVEVPNNLAIAGVDDSQARSFGLYQGRSEIELLSEIPKGMFALLLKHRPLLDGASDGRYDLQLSGHVHKGQIFPFSVITALYYNIQAGLATLPDGSSLYVSRGSGTWGPPIRFLSPPEVTVIDIVHAEE